MHRITAAACRIGLLLLASGALSGAAAGDPGSAPAVAPTINSEGEVGLTSYLTLPFESKVYGVSWGSSPSLAPSVLFWDAGAHFHDANTMAAARLASSSMAAQGLVPFSGSQRWQDTYEISQPADLFHGEPAWLARERNQLKLMDQPEFKAWVAWQKARPGLAILASDGGSVSVEWRAWGGDWGHISPLMPLARQDWPPGMPNATYGDWYAYRWGEAAAISGAFGIGLSDFSDSQPHLPSWLEGFNPEIIDAFGKSIGREIPGASVPPRAAYITAHLLPEWDDFLCQGYANFYAQLARQLTLRTGRQALVIDQCGFWPAARRLFGTDARIFARAMPARNILCIWDDHTMAPERGGESMLYGIGGMVIAAAREPDIRNGGNLSADAPDYWEAVAKFWGDLSPAEQRERGLKELKRAWLETCWAHIATRQGATRRALAFVSRTYWDAGKIDPDVQRLIQTIVPTRPFGFALYYSTIAERKVEPELPTHGGVEGAYFHPRKLVDFKNGGGALNYYVSDAGLPNLRPESRPAAWVVLDRPDLLSDGELRQLKAIAPVVTSLDQALHFPGAPLGFSAGLTGDGFYDQRGRLIITVSNPGASALDGAIALKSINPGPCAATDLITGQRIPFTVAGTGASIPVHVDRWDTRAFAITTAASAKSNNSRGIPLAFQGRAD